MPEKQFLKFPRGFLWGTATSAHQIEGGCDNNDWSRAALEKYKSRIKWADKAIKKIPDAGIACDSWNRYKEDIQIAKDLNTKLFRFSLEWSKIEPAKNYFDKKAIKHYRDVLKEAKKQGLKTMVGLHHFTNPIWTTEFNGWEKKKMVKHFLKYVKKVTEEFGDLVDFWTTINEPVGYAASSYALGIWPPMKKNIFKALLVFKNLGSAHKKSYKSVFHLQF